MQKSSQRSSDGAKLRSPLPRPISLQSLKPNARVHSPNPPTVQRKRRQPRSSADAESGSPSSPRSTLLHPGLEHRQNELCNPGSSPACRRRYAACALGLSCRHRTLWGPLFRRLDALAVDHGCTGTGLTSLLLSKSVSQSIMDSLPSAVLTPRSEVAIHRLIRGKVLRQHAPCAPTSAYIEDGIDHSSQRSCLRAASGLGRRQERGNNIPFRIRSIAWVTHNRYFSMAGGNFRDTLSDNSAYRRPNKCSGRSESVN